MLTKKLREEIENGNIEIIKNYFNTTNNMSDKDRVIDLMIHNNQSENVKYSIENFYTKQEVASSIRHWFSYAVLHKSADVVGMLMQSFKEYDYDFDYPSVMRRVTKNKDVELFKILIKNGASFFHIDKNYHIFSNLIGSTKETIEMLNIALQHDHKLQLDYGNYIERACSLGNIENVKIVVNHCENKNLLNKDLFKRALSFSCRDNMVEVVKYLLTNPTTKKYVDISFDNDEALAFACHNGQLETIDFLLKSPELSVHADVKSQSYRAVMWAAENGQLETIQYLFNNTEIVQEGNYKIDIDNVFYSALESKNIDLIQYLLEDDKIVNKPDLLLYEENINSVIMSEHMMFDHEKIVKYLITKGLPTTFIEKEGSEEIKYWLKSYQAEQFAEKLENQMDSNNTTNKKLKL